MANQKIYEMVTERVIDKIKVAIASIEKGETGMAPWHRPWHQSGIPQNLVSKKGYRGINVFLLSALGYASPFFVTFNQAKTLGGKVKKGEKGCPVVFWKWMELDKDEDGNKLAKTKKIPFLRYYTVFNVDQCEGFEEKIPAVETREFNPIAEGDAIISGMPNPPTINHGEARAYYSPSMDTVNLPRHELFNSDSAYYCVAFHELIHSTGHASRLNRNEVMDGNTFGNHDYSIEELVAEMGAVYLCNEIGLDTMFDNSLAYLKSWLSTFKDDVKLLVTASGRAQKAVDYMLNIDNSPKKDDDE